MTADLDVLCVGEALVVLAGAHVGRISEERSLTMRTAGAELNVAVGLARLGLRVAWGGVLSNDGLGELVTQRMRMEGIDERAVGWSDAPTGLMFKQQRAVGRTQIVYHRKGSAGSTWTSASIEEHLGACRWLHMSGVTPALGAASAAESIRLVEAARAAGVRVSFDVNNRPTLWSAEKAGPVLAGLASRADVVFADDVEAELAGLHRPEPGDRGPHYVWRHDGGHVELFVDGERYEHRGGWHEALDPVGAGDAFAAGYLFGLERGYGPEERLALAAEMGSWAVRVPGDHENLPTLAELEASRGATDNVAR